MYDDPKSLDADLFDEVQTAVQAAIIQIIDQRSPQSALLRRQLSVIAGKALVLTGASFIGAALELPADAGLAPGLAALAEFQRLAREKNGGVRP